MRRSTNLFCPQISFCPLKQQGRKQTQCSLQKGRTRKQSRHARVGCPRRMVVRITQSLLWSWTVELYEQEGSHNERYIRQYQSRPCSNDIQELDHLGHSEVPLPHAWLRYRGVDIKDPVKRISAQHLQWWMLTLSGNPAIICEIQRHKDNIGDSGVEHIPWQLHGRSVAVRNYPRSTAFLKTRIPRTVVGFLDQKKGKKDHNSEQTASAKT